MLGRVEEHSSSDAVQPDNQRPPILQGNSSCPIEGAPNWNGYIMYGATVVSNCFSMFTHLCRNSDIFSKMAHFALSSKFNQKIHLHRLINLN